MKYVLLIFAFLTSCGVGYEKDCTPMPWDRQRGFNHCDNGVVFEKVMDEVQQTAIKFLYERRLKLEDSNVWYGNSLEKIRLDFSTMALLDFCDARALLVDLVEDITARLEANNDLMLELQQRYIDPHIFEVYIDFKAYMGKFVDYDYVGWISLENGCANYYAFDMRTEKLDWWQRRSETYTESRAIVNAMRRAGENWEDSHKPKEPPALEENRFILPSQQ